MLGGVTGNGARASAAAGDGGDVGNGSLDPPRAKRPRRRSTDVGARDGRSDQQRRAAMSEGLGWVKRRRRGGHELPTGFRDDRHIGRRRAEVRAREPGRIDIVRMRRSTDSCVSARTGLGLSAGDHLWRWPALDRALPAAAIRANRAHVASDRRLMSAGLPTETDAKPDAIRRCGEQRHQTDQQVSRNNDHRSDFILHRAGPARKR